MTRKIIHVDMDAFYASVELRENPSLLGKPVVVAWDSGRSVICAASYEARKYGLRSAMSVAKARILCPQAIYVPPNFDLYRSVSRQVRSVFERYTNMIEPLSLDEAYLDVTVNFKNLPSATAVANAIRADILSLTGLTASAGVAPNKFLAKIASDWRKPNGLFVISPAKVQDFLAPLPLQKIPGVGKVTLAKFHQLGMFTVSDLLRFSDSELVFHFGKFGHRLYQLARGVDERPVESNQVAQQISTETTFDEDISFAQIEMPLMTLCTKLWGQLLKKNKFGCTVTLKLKTNSFRIITRSKTFSVPLHSQTHLVQAGLSLLERVDEDIKDNQFRLAGIGVSHFPEEHQAGQQLSLL
ncbi:DNA polymerase IV [Advenella sp. RU8]|uniref:DNA polymerase IV n=1 Tax=Advenella sp. RU8 TaxID=3399575 RepID=UPI003AAF16C5